MKQFRSFGRHWRRRRSGGRVQDAGAVTAEAAVVLPVLVIVVVLAAWLFVCVGAQLRCVDAARLAARAAARGDAPSAAADIGRSAAPRGAHVSVTQSGEQVTVAVTVWMRGPGPVLSRLGGTQVSARAVAHVEPGVGDVQP